MDESIAKYFIADVDDLPIAVRSDGNVKFNHSTIKYSVLGVTQDIWDAHLKDAGYTVVTADEAIIGSSHWGKVGAQISDYVNLGDGMQLKEKVDILEPNRAYGVILMKKVATEFVKYAITQKGNSDATYNTALLTSIDNCTTMESINTIWEDYLGGQLPKEQAQSEGKYENDGFTRTYNAGRVKPDFIPGL
tara:strand:+ start:162 stop:734 length:573 start_codon:yes stop_codon:yes gene_type:complete